VIELVVSVVALVMAAFALIKAHRAETAVVEALEAYETQAVPRRVSEDSLDARLRTLDE
jgi:hypothetical protein